MNSQQHGLKHAWPCLLPGPISASLRSPVRFPTPSPPAPLPHLEPHEGGGRRRVLHIPVLLHQLLQVVLQPSAAWEEAANAAAVAPALDKAAQAAARGMVLQQRKPAAAAGAHSRAHSQSQTKCTIWSAFFSRAFTGVALLTVIRVPARAAAGCTAAQTCGLLLRGRPWRRPDATAIAAGQRQG